MRRTYYKTCVAIFMSGFLPLLCAGGIQGKPEEPLTHNALVEAAKNEKSLTIYTPSSRTNIAAEKFGKKYGLKISTTQLKDSEMIEKVTKEAAANLDAADVIFCQDGARVYPELIMSGYVESYIPPSLNTKIFDPYRDPVVWELCNKVFVYNCENEKPIYNVWQLTEPEWRGRVQMKDPFAEGVNMNFLTMLTRDDWAQKIAQAYKDFYGKDIVLTTKNAGYEWIKAFYANGLVLGKSDTRISENVGAKGQDRQLVGLFTLNKLRTAESKDLALKPCYNINPFSGFLYPVYAFIPANSRSRDAAKLYIEYAMTEEGWEPFDTIGDYSPNSDIQNNEDNITLAEWGNMLVYEDPQWCAEHRAEVEEFISDIY